MNRRAFLAACEAGSGLAGPAPAGAPRPRLLSAREALDRMAEVYARCNRYRDAGCVTTVLTGVAGPHTYEKPFTTAFVRPDRLRYEYRVRNPDGTFGQRYIVYASGRDIQTWWTLNPGLKPAARVGLALAGATGVGGGSAATVPAMLLPGQVSGGLAVSLAAPERIEDAALDGADCLRVRGQARDKLTTVWIDRGTFLLRRIDTRLRAAAFSADETTTYDPVVGDVPEALLAFRPPEAP